MKSSVFFLYVYMLVNVLSYVLILRLIDTDDVIVYALYLAFLPLVEIINGAINANLIISMKRPASLLNQIMAISICASIISSFIVLVYLYIIGRYTHELLIVIMLTRTFQTINAVHFAIGERYMLFGRNALMRLISAIGTLILIMLVINLIPSENFIFYKDMFFSLLTFLTIIIIRPNKSFIKRNHASAPYSKRRLIAIMKRSYGFNFSQLSTIYMTRFPIFILSIIMPAPQFVLLMQAQYLSNIYNALINPLTEKLLFILRTNYKHLKFSVLDNFLLWFIPLSLSILLMSNYFGGSIIVLILGEQWSGVVVYLNPMLVVTILFIAINYKKHLLIAQKKFLRISIAQICLGTLISICWFINGFEDGLQYIYLTIMFCFFWVIYDEYKDKSTACNN